MVVGKESPPLEPKSGGQKRVGAAMGGAGPISIGDEWWRRRSTGASIQQEGKEKDVDAGAVY